MILAAALLVLVALGLFVGGIVTGNTTLYWACVGVSAGAAVLLILARRQLGRPGTAAPPAARSVAETRNRETTAPTSMTQTTTQIPTRTIPADPPPAEQPADPAQAHGPEDTTQAHRPTDGAAAADERPVREQAAGGAHAAPDTEPARGAHAAGPAGSNRAAEPAEAGEPPVEEVEVTDLLLVVDLKDEVLVVDEHPRYHLAGCPRLTGQETIPLPVDEARRDGFTPCAGCSPDRHLADLERARRAARRAP